ncbi:NAD-dependent epimerase/dehydratase family protein [Wenyingzhuangia sp. 2_MG-2023]|uniref:NAD-dependent epimerase/dehydratase family protein n=1 Tax=Wenyingzhuangia sp. 2_MG-2023 TaxID=3062639 RepID=UPI0026E38EAC|nr:NAD-dependent epimerase/dehydratase family protein [Wenyingzhuangia sp. 2_MG-2023]MDO6736996.1 NAD-dependent epimerase/dehydratase family protein [Wenyingzhuangia sp. 2_MG-2023]
MILVTGGTGLVGAHLLYKLCKQHDEIVATYRNEDSQKHTKEIFKLYGDCSHYHKIIWRNADVTDIPALEIAFQDITLVYHAAAMVSFNPKDDVQLRKVNIEGTANIVNLCLSNQIQKLCFVSSIATLSKKPGIKIVDESCEWNPEEDHSDYSISKFGAEMEIWRGAQEGLPVVIVNPGVIFGFGMWHANTSKLFVQIKNKFPFYTKGVTGVVAVNDVTKAMIQLMESTIQNQRFVLVTQNISFKNLFDLIAEKLQVSPPRFYAPKGLTEILWRINSFLSFLSFYKIDNLLNKYSSRSAHNQTNYSGNNIKRSIDFTYTPFDISIQEIADKLS